jgi:hypothetical protein
VILWRLLPWEPDAPPDGPGGALWFPRQMQGAGRHDNPDRYGCLYLGESPVSVVVEALAPFRGARELRRDMLVRAGVPLAIARLWLDDHARVMDLDDPSVLLDESLRPSTVATRARHTTQSYALRLFEAHPAISGLRWWSTVEASFINVTLFDRAAVSLEVAELASVTLDDPVVREAAQVLGFGG